MWQHAVKTEVDPRLASRKNKRREAPNQIIGKQYTVNFLRTISSQKETVK